MLHAPMTTRTITRSDADILQRGGIDSDRLVRVLVCRARGDRNRARFDPQGAGNNR